MAETQIDVNVYIDNLPTFKERVVNFNKDWKDILGGKATQTALAILEEAALLLEKDFLGIDYTLSDAPLKALDLKGKISGIRFAIEKLVSLANGENDE